MIQKEHERSRAVSLRKQGKTYNEILEIVPVAKSTLSLWLRDVGLAKKQEQKLSAKRRAAQLRGSARRHEIRIENAKRMYEDSIREVKKVTKNELFLIGVALYWAEGAKERLWGKSTLVEFANSDPAMISLFLKWLIDYCDVPKSEIALRLHLHQNYAQRESELLTYWSEVAGMPKSCFIKTNFKKHNPKTKRTKTDEKYVGLVSVRVKKSTMLNRRIQGWIYGIIKAQN